MIFVFSLSYKQPFSKTKLSLLFKTIVSNDVQPANGFEPIDVTVDGMITCLSFEQEANASPPI